MAKLYFKFGAMGCSKTAQALITKFNYEERNMKVLLLKPAVDDRDGVDAVRSRIGIRAGAAVVQAEENIYETKGDGIRAGGICARDRNESVLLREDRAGRSKRERIFAQTHSRRLWYEAV